MQLSLRGIGRAGALAILSSLSIPWCVAAAPDLSAPIGIIVVPTEQEAHEIRALLERGADFAALARTKSIDPTAGAGGYLGKFNRGDLRPELQAALEGLKPGQISPIARIQAGYAILKLLTADPRAPLAETHRDRLQFLSGSSGVRWTADYSGYNTLIVAWKSLPKTEGWNRTQEQVCRIRDGSTPEAVGLITGKLAQADLSRANRTDLISARAAFFAADGQFDHALEDLEAVYRSESERSSDKAPFFREWLGALHLERAGSALYDTFVLGGPPVAPPPPERAADLERAIAYFKQSLEEPSQAGNDELRWLLNLAYMLLGRYPASVPARWLIPEAVFRSAAASGRFRDVAAQAGISSHAMAGGVIADDFDNDGLIDLIVSSLDDCKPLKFFHNNGDGTFTDRAAQAGLGAQTGGLNVAQADYDNDGCLDILVMRGGWEFPRRRSLLHNNCDGTFTDVTEKAGLLDPLTSSQSAVWADIDNDGKLDLFVANENGPNQLFLNQGDGTFLDIAHAAGVDHVGFAKAVVAADYDNDGYTDFYVSNYNGENLLYHNNGNRTFTEVAARSGVQDPWSSFGAFFFDYDNDGWPDLFVAAYCTSVEESIRGYLGLSRKCESSKLYHNLRNGAFEDVTVATGLDRAVMAMGLNFGDIDNDGFLDFYLGSGSPSFASVLPNRLFRNEGGRRFTDVTAAAGTGILPKGHGIAFADLTNRGHQDIVAVMGGPVRADHQAMRVFENPGNGNDWINLRLVGTKSNRSAIGARISVTVTTAAGPRSIRRTVSSGGSFGASPLAQHIGLGKAARIEKLEIRWPAGGPPQTFRALEKNQFLEIRELADSPKKLTRPQFRLGPRPEPARSQARAAGR